MYVVPYGPSLRARADVRQATLKWPGGVHDMVDHGLMETLMPNGLQGFLVWRGSGDLTGMDSTRPSHAWTSDGTNAPASSSPRAAFQHRPVYVVLAVLVAQLVVRIIPVGFPRLLFLESTCRVRQIEAALVIATLVGGFLPGLFPFVGLAQ